MVDGQLPVDDDTPAVSGMPRHPLPSVISRAVLWEAKYF